MKPNDYVKFCSVCSETKQNTSLCFNNEKFREFTKGYFYLFEPKEDTKICPCCEKGILENSPLTFEEFKIIDDVSDSDRQFLEAMIELKKNNPIEYQLKMSQFKANLSQQQVVEQKSSNTQSSQRTCRFCGSTSFTPVKRKWSPLTGFLTNKTDLVCNNCGKKVQWIDR